MTYKQYLAWCNSLWESDEELPVMIQAYSEGKYYALKAIKTVRNMVLFQSRAVSTLENGDVMLGPPFLPQGKELPRLMPYLKEEPQAQKNPFIVFDIDNDN